jgi:hypothetical protein
MAGTAAQKTANAFQPEGASSHRRHVLQADDVNVKQIFPGWRPPCYSNRATNPEPVVAAEPDDDLPSVRLDTSSNF